MCLVVDNLQIGAGSKKLVHGISFTLGKGEKLALLGRSGSGKSLTAAAITGTLGAEYWASGQISIFGQEAPLHWRKRARRPQKLAAVFQDSLLTLNPLVKVDKQLCIPLSKHHQQTRKAARKTAMDMLANLNFDDPEKIMASFPGELSGGQRQRICLAIAMITSPKLLVADEPTTALDTVTQMRLLRLLKDSCAACSLSILFITHDIKLAANICDQAILMEAGRLIKGPCDVMEAKRVSG